MTGEGPHPAPDMWGILDKMAASVNIIAITAATWGLRGEGVKGVAGSRVVVFSRVGGWEGDDGAIHGSEAAGKSSRFLAPGWCPFVLGSGSFIRIQSCPSLLPRLPASAHLRCVAGLRVHSKGPARPAQLLRPFPLPSPTSGETPVCVCAGRRAAGSHRSPRCVPNNVISNTKARYLSEGGLGT